MELIIRCQHKQALRAVANFLEDFHIVSIDFDTASVSVEILKQYRLSYGLLMADALIAATAVSNHFPLLTRNIKDFQSIEELVIEPGL